MRKLIVVPAILLAATLSAEIQLPQASPGATIVQEIGTSRVTITYHRPAVKGRKVWGDLVPYGKLWRLGANNATTLELSHDAKVGGVAVPAGKYALFAIPTASEWTFILNKKSDQWGAYFHNAADDVARFTVKPQEAESQEWFTIHMRPKSETAIDVNVRWEKVKLGFDIAFDVPAIVWKSIDTTLASPGANWEDHHQAARYALTTGTRLDDAMRWIDKAMENESFWNYELKALLLHKAGRTAEAYPLMEKAKELAKGKAPQEYIDGLDKTVAEWRSSSK